MLAALCSCHVSGEQIVVRAPCTRVAAIFLFNEDGGNILAITLSYSINWQVRGCNITAREAQIADSVAQEVLKIYIGNTRALRSDFLTEAGAAISK